MAIRFSCPACQQPLEIDDGWAGQSVACPYCRRVVTAPPASTWPTGGVPMATPGRPAESPAPGFGTSPTSGYGSPQPPGFAPPPPPQGYGPQAVCAPPRGGSAGWALALTIIGAGVLIALTLVWMVMVMKAGMESVGPNATPAQAQRAAEEIMMRGKLAHIQELALIGVAAMLASLGGLILAIRSLVRQEAGRGMAITACILAGIFLFCQTMFLMTLVMPRPAS